ncbi:MAG: MBL fold metallo-hydrolase [Anaerolineales bacterium]|nr:MBL fold metallo-hydrolase [Anaerolineales bacterium]
MIQPIRIELPTEYEAGPVNAYLFTEPDVVLVDTGVKSEDSWRALVAGLAAHGVGVGDLQRLVLTHAHVDHFGQARRLAERGVRVETAVVVADRLTRFSDIWRQRMAYYREVFLPQTGLSTQMMGYILAYFEMVAANYEDVPARCLTTFPNEGTVQLGGATWQVLHTPGHCSHQTIYYQPETRQLLSSDMLLPRTPTPVVETPADGRTRQPSLPTFLRSLERVAALDVAVVYPGHGEVFTDHAAVAAAQRARILRRAEEALACVQAGCRTAAEVVAKLYAGRPLPIQFAGLWMTLGYLDLLLAQGRIGAREEGAVVVYETMTTTDKSK